MITEGFGRRLGIFYSEKLPWELEQQREDLSTENPFPPMKNCGVKMALFAAHCYFSFPQLQRVCCDKFRLADRR